MKKLCAAFLMAVAGYSFAQEEMSVDIDVTIGVGASSAFAQKVFHEAQEAAQSVDLLGQFNQACTLNELKKALMHQKQYYCSFSSVKQAGGGIAIETRSEGFSYSYNLYASPSYNRTVENNWAKDLHIDSITFSSTEQVRTNSSMDEKINKGAFSITKAVSKQSVKPPPLT